MQDNTIINNPVNDDELTLKIVVQKCKNLYRFLLTKWIKIIITAILGAAIGLAYSMYKKPLYIAQLSFALEDAKNGGGMSAYSGLASQFGLDIGSGGGAFTGDNLMELMKSRTLIDKTLLTTVNVKGKNETLAELYIEAYNLRDEWSKKPSLASVQFLPNADYSKFTLTQDSLLGLFNKDLIANNLTVDKTDKKLSIILVKVVSKNELFSKFFAEQLVNNVSQFYIQTKTEKSSRNVNILQHQTDSVRQQLNNAISGVAQSIDVNPYANPNRLILRAPAQHRQIDVQVNNAILAELVKNLEVSKVSLRNETPLIQIIDKPILPLDIERIGELKGIVVGFVIGFFVAVFGIIVKRVTKSILS